MKGLVRGTKAQGMTEYILIIALIAILVLGAVKMFGGKVKAGFNKASEKIGNEVDNMGSGS
jgi:Flp pilus assembly pilin Flp